MNLIIRGVMVSRISTARQVQISATREKGEFSRIEWGGGVQAFSVSWNSWTG